MATLLHPPTAPEILSFSGAILVVGGSLWILLRLAFCTPFPKTPLFEWLVISIILIGARLATRDNISLEVDQWWVAFIWINCGLAVATIAGWSLRQILSPRRVSCRYREGNP
jgi:hypothetical protein